MLAKEQHPTLGYLHRQELCKHDCSGPAAADSSHSVQTAQKWPCRSRYPCFGSRPFCPSPGSCNTCAKQTLHAAFLKRVDASRSTHAEPGQALSKTVNTRYDVSIAFYIFDPASKAPKQDAWSAFVGVGRTCTLKPILTLNPKTIELQSSEHRNKRSRTEGHKKDRDDA